MQNGNFLSAWTCFRVCVYLFICNADAETSSAWHIHHPLTH